MVVGPCGLKPRVSPLASPMRGGPVDWSGVMPIPRSAAVGCLMAGTDWVVRIRCAVTRATFSNDGDNILVYDRDPKYRFELPLIGKNGVWPVNGGKPANALSVGARPVATVACSLSLPVML